MELRQLRYFVGVSEAGSLLKASARLHVAQPALGQQIADLEHAVGARLFDRSSRGMALTEAGKVFLEHAKVVLADVERARVAVRDSSAIPSGDVVVGLPTTVAFASTVPILRVCRERVPLVRLKIVEAYSGFLREWLQAGRLDVALLFGDAPETGLAKRPLLDEQLAFVTNAKGSRLPKKMPLRSVARWPLILPGREHGLRRIIDEACEAESLVLDVIAEVESLSSVKRAVEEGLGSTILSLSSVAEDVAAGRLRAATIASTSMSRRVVCATNITRPTTAAGAAVMGLVTEVIGGMVRSGAWPARWVGDQAA
jgi:LysR family nitrogen assimilation transcriptional regulator